MEILDTFCVLSDAYFQNTSLPLDCPIEKANRSFLTNKPRIILTKCILEWLDFTFWPVISSARLSNSCPKRNSNDELHRLYRLIVIFAFSVEVPPTDSYQTLNTCLNRAGLSRKQCWWTAETHCVAAGGFVKWKKPKSSSSASYIERKRAMKLMHQKEECRYQRVESTVAFPFVFFTLNHYCHRMLIGICIEHYLS